MKFSRHKLDSIVISGKFKHSDNGSKYFIGYEDDIIRPLCIVLPQMSGYKKYFDKDGKYVSFKIKGDNVLVKYIDIWNKIKEKLGIKFDCNPVHDEIYIKNKVLSVQLL